jgi:hypothetical protein
VLLFSVCKQSKKDSQDRTNYNIMGKGYCEGRQIGTCLPISDKMPKSSHCLPCVAQHHSSAKRWCFPLSIILPCVAFSTPLRLTNFSTAHSTTISSYVQSAALSHPWTSSVPPGKSHPPHQQVICTQGCYMAFHVHCETYGDST